MTLAYHHASLQALEREQIFELPSLWGDASQYLSQSVKGYQLLSQTGWHSFFRYAMTSAHERAPLFQHVCSLWYVVFGESLRSALWSQWVYLALLVITVFLISLRTFQSYLISWVAASVVLGSPSIIAYSRAFMSEVPLTALTTLSVLIFLQSDCLTSPKRRYAMILGITIGLCLLTKTMAPVYLVGPMGYGFIAGYRMSKHPAAYLRRVAVCVVCALLIASLWWGRHLSHVMAYLLDWSYGTSSESQSVAQLDYLREAWVFLKWLVEDGTSTPLFIVWVLSVLMIIGAPLLRRAPRHAASRSATFHRSRDVLGCVSAWVAIPLLLHLSTHNKAPQFIVCFVPPLALAFAATLNRLRTHSSTFFQTAGGLAMISACVNVGILTFGVAVPESLRPWIAQRDKYYHQLKDVSYHGITNPSDLNWHLDDVASYIDTNRGEEPVTIAFLLEEVFFNASSFRYLTTVAEHDYYAIHRFDPATAEYLTTILEQAGWLVAFADHASYEKRFHPRFTVNPTTLQHRLAEGQQTFKRARVWLLPNGLRVALYRKTRMAR